MNTGPGFLKLCIAELKFVSREIQKGSCFTACHSCCALSFKYSTDDIFKYWNHPFPASSTTGLGSIAGIEIRNFQVLTPNINIGDALAFTFQLANIATSSALVRLEYGLHYQKANGTLSRKVFKISERVYPKQSTTTIERKQPFKIITTRKLHPGLHQLSLIINGKELEKLDFNLAAGL